MPFFSPSQHTLQMCEARDLRSHGFRKMDQTPHHTPTCRLWVGVSDYCPYISHDDLGVRSSK